MSEPKPHSHGGQEHSHGGGDHPHIHQGVTDQPWKAVKPKQAKGG